MTFEEIVNEVCERLNLVSDEAKSRVGREINNRYKRVTSSTGLQTSRFIPVSAHSVSGDRNLTFTGVEKILAVIDKTDPKKDIVLEQITPDEMHIVSIRSQPPRKYAVLTMNADSVTIQMDCIPDVTGFTLYADALDDVSTLAGNARPAMPESFHDILIYGAMADEYRRMEKQSFYRDAETDYEKRLSDLRLFIANSAYLDQYQGRYNNKNARSWNTQFLLGS